MNKNEKYIIQSLELHLFFARIMKEHSIFLEAGFTPRNADFARQADVFKLQFETILHNAVILSNGIVSNNVLASGEVITEFTLETERKTEDLTGININQNITMMEANLLGSNNPRITPELASNVNELNYFAKISVENLIQFKERLLSDVLDCKMFTVNYPLLIDHILREAKLYHDFLICLENGKDLDTTDFKEMELFWDQIMMEHALFIRGLLDPTEGELINTANDFAGDYGRLIEKTREANDYTIMSISKDTLKETIKYQNFKTAGTQGITECNIKSIIVPLLADHVLRESNHFIRILKNYIN